MLTFIYIDYDEETGGYGWIEYFASYAVANLYVAETGVNWFLVWDAKENCIEFQITDRTKINQ